MSKEIFVNENAYSWMDGRDVCKALASLGAMPNRRFGQNFLTDRRVAVRMIEALDLGSEDIVFEIGPGLGALTGLLLQRAKKVIAIEIDTKLFGFLTQRFKEYHNLEILNADFLELDIKEIFQKIHTPGALKVIGNLPYRISSQILFKLLECPVHPERMVLSFQWEVAERLIAGPGTKDYAAITLMAQYYTQISHLLRVKSHCFYPRPGVDTGILMFVFRALDLGLNNGSQENLFHLIKSSFAQRRKTLKNALSHSRVLFYEGERIEKALIQCHLDIKTRAEDLTLMDFARLLNALEGTVGE